MVHVWYVQYGDTAHNVDAKAIYNDALLAIQSEDPNAVIEEIRQYPFQIAFYVNHPTWTTAALAEKQRLIGIIASIFLISLAIASVLASAGFFITAYLAWEKEHRWYAAKDPVTGEEIQIFGWSNYLGWLAQNDPAALQALQDFGATNWWEQIGNWIPIVLLLIGAVIFIPLITKLIPGRR